jgi:hypothetical protein
MLDMREGGVRVVLVPEVCRGNVRSFRRHTHWDVVGHFEWHCYHQLLFDSKLVIPHKYHFLLEFAVRIGFRTNFPVEMQQLLQRLTFARHNLQVRIVSSTGVYKSNDMHK